MPMKMIVITMIALILFNAVYFGWFVRKIRRDERADAAAKPAAQKSCGCKTCKGGAGPKLDCGCNKTAKSSTPGAKPGCSCNKQK